MSPPPGARCGRHPELEVSALCARCGDFLCARCVARVLEEAAYCRGCEPVAGEPFVWERRDELGVGRALLETAAGVLLRPRETFAPGFRDRSAVAALGFGLVWSTPVTFVTTAVELTWPSADRVAALREPQPLGWLYTDESLLALGLMAPVTFILGVALLAGLWWAALKVLKSAPRPLSHVVRAVAYVQGATAPIALLMLVPRVADVVTVGALLLSSVLQALALSAVMRAPAVRVMGAGALVVLGLALVTCLGAVAVAAALAAVP